MANTRLLSRALDVKHADTITIANTWAQGDTISLEANSRDFVVTIGTLVTTSQVAITLKQAYNGETLTDTAAFCVPPISDSAGQSIPELAELLATVDAAVVTLTGRVAGISHTIAATETTAGTGTATLANLTAATGKKFYNSADNWTEGSTPGTADNAYLDNEDTDILYGLANAGQTLALLSMAANYTGKIGLPKENANVYTEYRPDYLAVDASIVRCGEGSGLGSGRIKIDNGTVATALSILKTGQSDEQGLPAFIWKGTNASNSLTILSGTFGAAIFGGEVATLSDIYQVGGTVTLGSGCTLGNIVVEGGTMEINSAVATLTVTGGEVVIYGSGNIDTLTVTGGRVRCMTHGTIGDLIIGGAGQAVIDFTGDNTPRTVTATSIGVGAEILFAPDTITFTTPPEPTGDVRRLVAA